MSLVCHLSIMSLMIKRLLMKYYIVQLSVANVLCLAYSAWACCWHCAPYKFTYYIIIIMMEVNEYFGGLTCWQMVAANIIQSFDEAGLNNADEVADVGKRQVWCTAEWKLCSLLFIYWIISQFTNLKQKTFL